MLATIITEEQWLKLKSILLDLNVYEIVHLNSLVEPPSEAFMTT
jgi:hypothetical protein